MIAILLLLLVVAGFAWLGWGLHRQARAIADLRQAFEQVTRPPPMAKWPQGTALRDVTLRRDRLSS